MSRTLMLVSAFALALPAAALATGRNETETVGTDQTRNITITDRASGQTGQASRVADHEDEIVIVSVDWSMEQSVSAASLGVDALAVDVDLASGIGTLEVRSGQVVTDTLPRGAVEDAEELLALLVSFQQTPGDYVFEPEDPAVQIDWDCEIATLRVIAECGTFDFWGCGEAVDEQFCACLPDGIECD